MIAVESNSMSNYPDFESYGYQIKRELGQNSAGGRVTYLATNTKTQLYIISGRFSRLSDSILCLGIPFPP